MLILISFLLLFATSLALMILRMTPASARIAWLAAVGGAMFALISVLAWLMLYPFETAVQAWRPIVLFTDPVVFRADSASFPVSLSVVALTLSILLTAVARSTLTNAFTWAGTLALGGIGLLAVTANNAFTLLLVWSALDVIEFVTQLRAVEGVTQNEKVVVAFATRLLGSGLLLWANMTATAAGGAAEFSSMPAGVAAYLIVAAGLRLGVLPLHLPYAAESTVRRGFGTALRLISAAASIALLARVPAGGLSSTAATLMLAFATLAAAYGGWMWLRAPDELNGRPYWVIGLAALAVIATLSGNPTGAVAWGGALILVGGALFLSSIQNLRLNRALLLGAWSLSSLPFSLTGGAWLGSLGFFSPLVVVAQSLLVAGFIRHASRPAGRDSLDDQPLWMRTTYLSGIVLLVALQVLLGFLGWDGARQIGAWLHALAVAGLTAGLVWATPRLRVLNPVRTHWVNSTAAQVNNAYQGIWTLYRALETIGRTVTNTLESESGIMWTLLFLALFISLLAGGR